MRVTTIEQAGFTLSEYATLYNRIFSDYQFPLTSSEARLQRQLASGVLEPRYCLVAEEAGEPIGLLLAGVEALPQEVKVQALGIVPASRRMGAGAALLAKLLDTARTEGVARLRLMVLSSNHNALGFYRHMGFSSAGTRECYLLPLPARLPTGNAHLCVTRIPTICWSQPEGGSVNPGELVTTVLVAKAGEQTVGHLVTNGEETMTIESLYTRADWRRRRVASSLLRAALAASPLTTKIRLNYLPRADRSARRFLRCLGFRCYCRLEEMVNTLPASEQETTP